MYVIYGDENIKSLWINNNVINIDIVTFQLVYRLATDTSKAPKMKPESEG